VPEEAVEERLDEARAEEFGRLTGKQD
jgi:hypothetical protein